MKDMLKGISGKKKKQPMVPKEDHEKLKKYFYEEIKRRDKKIEELEEKNLVLLKSALRQAEKGARWQDLVDKQPKKEGLDE